MPNVQMSGSVPNQTIVILMFIIKFRKSTSKNYPLAVKLAGVFDDHEFKNDLHCIRITVKEIFEKWEYFNMIFWKTAGWVESSFGYDGYNLMSLEDRKRLFYSLQSAHSMWLGLSSDYLKRLAPVYFDESLDPKLRNIIFNEKDIDVLLDLINAEKIKEEFNNEYEGF